MGLLSQVVTKAPSLPSRVYLYAQEKWGKSSFAANAPKPIFIMTEGETGLLSLLEAGLVPETAHFPEDAKSWPRFLEYVQSVRFESHDYRTLVIDTTNGAERLLTTHVCDTEFDGNMSATDGYMSFGKGNDACVPHWMRFLRLLDEIRVQRKMSILLLAHSKIKSVNNPEGSDYDQLRPEGVDKLWTLTHKWADVIAGGTFDLFVKGEKVKESRGRVIRTSNSAAVVAGNRYSMPPVIQCGNNAKTAFANFAKALAAAKGNGKKAESAPPTVPTPVPDPNPATESAEPELPTPDPEGVDTEVPEWQRKILSGCHLCDLTWNQFMEQFGEDLGFSAEQELATLDEGEQSQVVEKINQVYAQKHPKKAKQKEAQK